MNTVLIIFSIGNTFDDTSVTKVIAVLNDDDIDYQVSHVYNALLDSEFVQNYQQLQLTSNDIYCNSENDFDSIFNDLKSFGLLK